MLINLVLSAFYFITIEPKDVALARVKAQTIITLPIKKKVYLIINLQEVCPLLQAHFQTNNKITCFKFKDKLNALNGPLLEHLI
jgi:hypothetical protein